MDSSTKLSGVIKNSVGNECNLPFELYSGAGNTFILMDGRDERFPHAHPSWISSLCSQLSVDGICLLSHGTLSPLRMRIFNTDGSEATMCGNGLRCFKAYLDSLGLARKSELIEVGGRTFYVTTVDHSNYLIDMTDPRLLGRNIPFQIEDSSLQLDWIDTGVPHLVCLVEDIETAPVESLGPLLRYHPQVAPEGANVNFFQELGRGEIAVRTYERGVERETGACGTGCTASVIAFALRHVLPCGPIMVRVRSGEILCVDFKQKNDGFHNVTLAGPATRIFSGCWDFAS